MEKEFIKTGTQDIIRSVKEKGNVKTLESLAILDAVSEAVEAVDLDNLAVKRYLQRKIDEQRRRKLSSFLTGSENKEQALSEDLPEFYKLNKTLMRDIVVKVYKALSELEKRSSSELDDKEKRNADLKEKLEAAEKLKTQLQNDNENIRRSTAASMQQVLSFLGKDAQNSDKEIIQEVTKLLRRLGFSAVWSSEVSPEDFDDMFDTLKVENLSAAKEKPCLMFGREVLLQGIRFELADAKGE